MQPAASGNPIDSAPPAPFLSGQGNVYTFSSGAAPLIAVAAAAPPSSWTSYPPTANSGAPFTAWPSPLDPGESSSPAPWPQDYHSTDSVSLAEPLHCGCADEEADLDASSPPQRSHTAVPCDVPFTDADTLYDDEEEQIAQRRAAKRGQLYISPSAAAEWPSLLSSSSSNAVNGYTDPIMLALRRQQQQRLAGEPTTPLSPRTLQRLLAASAAGSPIELSCLRPEDILAKPPLALTWHPSTTTLAGSSGGSTADSTNGAEVGREEEKEHGDEQSDAPRTAPKRGERKRSFTDVDPIGTSGAQNTLREPPRTARRLDREPGEAERAWERAAQPTQSTHDATERPSDVYVRTPKRTHSEGQSGESPAQRVPVTETESAVQPETTTADSGPSPEAEVGHKRGRDERVYEMMSHGRRLS